MSTAGTEPVAFSCQELVELVTDYLEGALDREDHARFEEHLAECGNCETYLEQMRTTIRLTGSLTVAHVTPEAEAELLAVFRQWRAEAFG